MFLTAVKNGLAFFLMTDHGWTYGTASHLNNVKGRLFSPLAVDSVSISTSSDDDKRIALSYENDTIKIRVDQGLFADLKRNLVSPARQDLVNYGVSRQLAQDFLQDPTMINRLYLPNGAKKANFDALITMMNNTANWLANIGWI